VEVKASFDWLLNIKGVIMKIKGIMAGVALLGRPGDLSPKL